MVHAVGRFALLGTACLAALLGCANGDPRERHRDPGVEEIAGATGCAPEQVAVCIEVSCEPDEYRCANRDELRDLFGAGKYFRH